MSTKKSKSAKKPIRLCVCCGKEKTKKEMLRIVISGRRTDIDTPKVDDTGKQHGRGAYICRNIGCINKAYHDDLLDDVTYRLCLDELEKARIQLLPIAMKSGNVAAGEYQCEETITTGQAFFTIIAEDASDNTKKKFIDKCTYRDVPYAIYSTKETLGGLIGKAERSVVVIKDADFGAQFKERFGGNE